MPTDPLLPWLSIVIASMVAIFSAWSAYSAHRSAKAAEADRKAVQSTAEKEERRRITGLAQDIIIQGGSLDSSLQVLHNQEIYKNDYSGSSESSNFKLEQQWRERQLEKSKEIQKRANDFLKNPNAFLSEDYERLFEHLYLDLGKINNIRQEVVHKLGNVEIANQQSRERLLREMK